MILTRDTIDILTIFIPYWDEDIKVTIPLSTLYEYYNTTSLTEIKKIMITVIHSAEWIEEDGKERFRPIIYDAFLDEKYITIYLTEYAQEGIRFIKSVCDDEKQKYLLSLSNTYAKRMYLYIREYCNTHKDGYTEIPILEFKEYMGVDKLAGYNNFTMFNDRCIMPSICEINDKTDVIICYEPVSAGTGKGKKVFDLLRFTIKEKPKKEKKKLLDNIVVKMRKRI